MVPVPGSGTEDVLVDDIGRIVTGLADGRILRVTPVGDVEELLSTGGRPLGLEWGPNEELIVCDAYRGLLSIDLDTEVITELVTEVSGARMMFCNNAAVAADGTIYFTDSSTRFGLADWIAELMEHSETGRLMRRDPDGTVTVLLDELAFANGVALAPDGSSVIVAETGGYRLRRHWLTGERAGSAQLFADSLPGFPDNISTGDDGLIWVSIASPRDRVLDLLLSRPGLLRSFLWSLPSRLLPKPKRVVRVQAYDVDGRLVHDLAAPATDFHMVTGVRAFRGTVWLGSLNGTAIASIRVPAG